MKNHNLRGLEQDLNRGIEYNKKHGGVSDKLKKMKKRPENFRNGEGTCSTYIGNSSQESFKRDLIESTYFYNLLRKDKVFNILREEADNLYNKNQNDLWRKKCGEKWDRSSEIKDKFYNDIKNNKIKLDYNISYKDASDLYFKSVYIIYLRPTETNCIELNKQLNK
jgi:hypothetical protein